MKLKLVACSLFILSASSSALAQQDIENVTVVGSRLDSLSSASTSVLTRQQIEQYAPTNTVELLRRIPHLQVAENGQAGGLSFVSIRGGETNFTLIMIDGITVNDPTNSRGGGFDFNQLSPSSIERVEVYRGGISAIYGGEAISGAINFVTREAGANSLNVSLGNQQQAQASLTLSRQINANNSILFNGSTQTREASEFAQHDNKQLLLKFQHRNANREHTVVASFSEQDNVGFAEDSGGDLFAMPQIAETRDSEQWVVGLNNLFRLSETLTLNANFSWVQHQEFANNQGIFPGVLSGVPASEIETNYKKSEVEAFVTWQAADNWDLLVGANSKNANGNNKGFVDFGAQVPVDFDLSLDANSAFIQSSSQHGNLTLDIGLRFDSPDDFDNEFSSRVSLAYAFSDNLRAFAVVNEGYKLPSFFALAHPLVGNPDLNPERSDNHEVGVLFGFAEKAQISITYFDNEFTNLVDFDAETFTSVNRSSVDTQGVEFDLRMPITSWFDMSVDVTYTDVDANEEGVTLRRRPNWSGSIAADFSWQDYELNSYLTFNDAFYDSSIATGLVKLGGSGILGFSANWFYSDALRLHLTVDNALGKTYQESVGFVIDDSSVRAGLQYNF